MFILSSCNNPLATKGAGTALDDDFRPGYQTPVPEDTGPTNSHPVGSSSGFKLTPGSERSVGTDSAGKFVMMPNDRRMQGTTVSGRFSLNKTRVR